MARVLAVLRDGLRGMFPAARMEIHNCAGEPYMTRWILFQARGYRLMLHRFHRGDSDREFHDHPWWFASLILWGGYWEQTPLSRKWYGPGRLLLRPATWAHRVMLPEGKKALTLVLSGRRQRKWGFWMEDGTWLYHRLFAKEKGCV